MSASPERGSSTSGRWSSAPRPSTATCRRSGGSSTGSRGDPALVAAALEALPGAASAPIHTSAAVGGAAAAIPRAARRGDGGLRRVAGGRARGRAGGRGQGGVECNRAAGPRAGGTSRRRSTALEGAIPLLVGGGSGLADRDGDLERLVAPSPCRPRATAGRRRSRDRRRRGRSARSARRRASGRARASPRRPRGRRPRRATRRGRRASGRRGSRSRSGPGSRARGRRRS